MPFKHPAVDEGAHDVLNTADNRKESVDPRTPRATLECAGPRRENMKTERQTEVDCRLPERVPHRVVVVA